MALTTVRNSLNTANPSNVADGMRRLYDATHDLGVADLFAAMRPRNRSRSGLTSLDTHVHDEAAAILSVESPQGTPLAIISGGSPGAGEVSVDYDATTGVPTLEFNGAVTEYHTTQLGPVPQGMDAALALNVGA